MPNEKKAEIRRISTQLLRLYLVGKVVFRPTPKNNISQLFIMAMELIKACIDKVTEKNATEKQKYLMYRKLGIKFQAEKTKHAMVTIQFKQEEVDDIEGLIPQLLNLKWLKDNEYWYTYEYFSKEYPQGGNLHAHLLVKQTDATLDKSKILRDVNRRFKKELKVVNYQHSSSKEHFANRLAYVRGDKQTTQYVVLDRVWKQENNISPYYTNGNEETHKESAETHEESGVISQPSCENITVSPCQAEADNG